MASKRQLARVLEWIARTGVTRIGDEEFAALRVDLSDIAEASLRRLVREADLPLAPLVEGVRQDGFENLARTLIALQHEHERDAGRAKTCRALVITAKDHARLAARKKPEKLEMVEWMLVWLENPPVFETWWKLKASRSAREEPL